MESKSMELKIMYCKDLKAFNFFQKLLVYVLVSLESEDPEKKLKQVQQQRTPTDKEDDGNPEWNHEMKFDLSEVSFVDCDHIFVHFDLRHEGLYFGDKTIGEVRVPLKDLIQESCGITRFVNYQVRSPEGKPNGLLNFSCKVNAQEAKDMGIHVPTTEITGYSVVAHHHHESNSIQHPASEADNSPPAIHYPPMESEDNSQEIDPSAQISYPTQGTQESPYPPAPYAYYPPPPPPPRPLLHHRPPPFMHGSPPPLCGACHHHPAYPPGYRPWVHSEVYDYSAHGNWSSTAGHSHSFSHGETWRHDYRAYWKGR